MNNKITFQQVVASLAENNQPFATLTLQNNICLIISQRGGRILGPFLSPDRESIFWLNRAFARPASLAEFLASGDWNLGGERIWIAPEIQYLVRDRSDFWGSIGVPDQMDPGQYTLDQPRPNQWRLSQEITLEAFNLATGQKKLTVEKRINRVEDPLRNLSNYAALLNGVIFAGYEQVVSLSEKELDDIVSEVWNLIQLNPGGQLLIPASPHVEHTDYYEPIDNHYQSRHPNYLSLKITGDRQYKVGYKAAHVFGRLAYFNHLDGGQAYLLVRNFFNNPAAPYAEEPAGAPGQRGHSIHVYNDDGNLGGFGELECNGQTIGGVTGKPSTTDQFVLWFYVGAVDKVKRLVPHLLGIEF
jgi:hypothetical protein